MEKISCTLGILTYNSAKSLAGALESVKDFGEILVADGGSTDETLAIARRYGATIMERSNPGHRITDFSLERNRMVEAAQYDWFFYIDSDERASPELVEAIRAVACAKEPQHLVYWVCFRKTNPDFSKVYRTFKEYYQPRFFNRTSGARFVRPMHERIAYDEKQYPAGRIHSPWYVSLEAEDLEFRSAMEKSRRRLAILADTWTPQDIGGILWRALLRPFVETAKSLFKMLYVKVRFGKDAVPARYEILRIYLHWVSVYTSVRRVLRLARDRV